MSNILQSIPGSLMRAARISQRKSAENIAESMGISRNTLMSYEKCEIVPIDIIRDFIEALGISSDQFWNLLVDLQVIDKDKSDSVGIDPKNFGNFLFDSFRSGLSDKESRLSELQRSNERLQNQLKGEEKNNFLLVREIDKFQSQLTLLEKNMENFRQQVEGKIKESHDRVYEKVEKRLEEILSEFNTEVKKVISKDESSGLGDFFVKTGLNSVVSSPPVAAAIAKAVLNFAGSEQDSEDNSQANKQNFSSYSAMPNVFNPNFPYPQGNNNMPKNNLDTNNDMLNNNQE